MFWSNVVNLRTVDLNLLPIFEAIYVEGSLTHAADTLNMTQPAVSQALKRLREEFDDPLFVRSGRGVAPTAVAESLIEPVGEALVRLRSTFQGTSDFDAEGSNRIFRISAGDVGLAVMAAGLARLLKDSAPDIRVSFRRVDRDHIAHQLATGELDLAIDTGFRKMSGTSTLQLLSQDYVCALRPGHPAAKGAMSLDAFLALRHIAVSSRPSARTPAEAALARSGHRLRSVMRFSNYAPAFGVIRETDYALVAPRVLAEQAEAACLPLPFACHRLDLALHWRKDREEDAAVAWLRDQIAECFREAGSAA